VEKHIGNVFAKRLPRSPLPHTLPPALLFGLLCAYAVGSLGAGAWSLIRHDA